jgi:NAD(P)-dependent dehydrogenase (short-subunit alcohol dehydrogenase family)
MIKTAVTIYGRLDILFNNAGITGKDTSTIESTTEEEWDRIMNINLKGVFLGSKYAIPVMRNQGGGTIINTSSVAGIAGPPGDPAYGASKAGVIQLTKGIAAAYGRYNIRANCICPGTIQTPIIQDSLFPFDDFMRATPLRRKGQPEEVARAVLYLASDDSSYVTGLALVIDGGWTLPLPVSRPVSKGSK